WSRAAKKLSTNDIRNFLVDNDDYYDFQNKTLDSLLKVRIPETPGHQIVQSFIIQSMKDLQWSVETDLFYDNTPHGSKSFTNIMATYNKNACKRLVFACHYDSKWTKTKRFLGATDSAVPCMIMISLANRLQSLLKNQKTKDEISLQYIFFDGEEAFKEWTDTDSLYGSRHLAMKWDKTPFPRTADEKKLCTGKYVSEIDRIELFVLLDLLGAPNPVFYSYFPETYSLHRRLVKMERKLNQLSLLEQTGPVNLEYFKDRQVIGGIQDDHIPFLKRDVPVLHLIPSPFPAVWHTDDDDRYHLHDPTINNLVKIFQLFIIEYLHL
ncbi:glutaminyl-peptide cyclotransferase-like protein, partial [Leptotrombidium deliense]